MAGFKKCGVYPLSPGEINDRDLAPSKATQWISTTSPSNNDRVSPLSSTSTDNALEDLCLKRFEEGYDIHDEECISWQYANHPDAIPPQFATGASVISFIPTSSSKDPSSRSVKSSPSAFSYLSEILVLPKPKAPVGEQRRKRKL